MLFSGAFNFYQVLDIIYVLKQKSKVLHNLFRQKLFLLALKVVFVGFLRQTQTPYLLRLFGLPLYNTVSFRVTD